MAVEVIDFQVYCYLVENVRTLHPEAGGTTFVLLLLRRILPEAIEALDL